MPGSRKRSASGHIDLKCIKLVFYQKTISKTKWLTTIKGCIPTKEPSAVMPHFEESMPGSSKRSASGHIDLKCIKLVFYQKTISKTSQKRKSRKSQICGHATFWRINARKRQDVSFWTYRFEVYKIGSLPNSRTRWFTSIKGCIPTKELRAVMPHFEESMPGSDKRSVSGQIDLKCIQIIYFLYNHNSN